jgi:hypothetical protein
MDSQIIQMTGRHGFAPAVRDVWSRAALRVKRGRRSVALSVAEFGAPRKELAGPADRIGTVASRLVALIAPSVALGLTAENSGRRASHSPLDGTKCTGGTR